LKILGIETSGPVFSLGRFDDQRLLYQVQKDRTQDPGRRDARWFDEVERLLSDPLLGQIDVLAVDIGPGMFTSLRIGLSLAKALNLARGIPLVGVTSLDAVGAAGAACGRPLLAVINAYQGEVYAARYEAGRRRGRYLLTTPGCLVNRLRVRDLVVGPGAGLMRGFRPRRSARWDVDEDPAWWPNAAAVVRAARPRLRRRSFDAPDYLEPFYIKRTDAERRQRARHDV
jgi:tRNA threonylcarbamoyladenosine biosynthesis protein TsaB